jgi:hypothetical protein
LWKKKQRPFNHVGKDSTVITLLVCLALSLGQTGNPPPASKTHLRAIFELEVKRSDAIKVGKRKLVCVTAIATDMQREGPIKFSGIDIFFLPENTLKTAPPNIREIKQGSYANVNLMLDKAGKLTQVNMTVITPGCTVARTVAWKPDDLQKFFSDVNVSAKRVVLRSQGTYDDSVSEREQMSLRWDVAVDVPVINEPKK